MSRILLVRPPPYPNDITEITTNVSYPLGLGCLAAFLDKTGVETQIHDMFIDKDFGTLRKAISDLDPDMIGISATMTYHYPRALKCIKIAKEFPDKLIVSGGAHVTFAAREALEDGVDYVALHEGETPLRNLVKTLNSDGDPSTVRGIAFMNNGEFVQTSPEQYIQNLDDLPIPRFDLLRPEKFPLKHLESTRGCPFSCIFCSEEAFWTRKWRTKTPGRTVEEMRLLVERFDTSRINFVDDTFTVDRKRTYSFCELLKHADFKVDWSCQTRIELLDRELLRSMSDAGCRSLFYGIECGYNEGIKLAGKNFTTDRVLRTIRDTLDVGIEDIGAGFIIGFPWETENEVRKTVEFAKLLIREYGVKANVYILKPYAGTPLVRDKEKWGYVDQPNKFEEYSLFYPSLRSRLVSRETLERYIWEFVESLPERQRVEHVAVPN